MIASQASNNARVLTGMVYVTDSPDGAIAVLSRCAYARGFPIRGAEMRNYAPVIDTQWLVGKDRPYSFQVWFAVTSTTVKCNSRCLVTGGVASSRQLGLGLGQSGGFLDIM
ncbi:hypothetical protein F5878DRAFT_642637 [Lentinula raphanica]|uniref:Uncharacterized protein n=1 Tax=Lentinula raphanica TaxID=153919 RepID=A0AA38P790_9AGAR|nr:hypothetical protein F5878DRAFT_642637 [Lentinula raphanica]